MSLMVLAYHDEEGSANTYQEARISHLSWSLKPFEDKYICFLDKYKLQGLKSYFTKLLLTITSIIFNFTACFVSGLSYMKEKNIYSIKWLRICVFVSWSVWYL